jgi:hypothetical protein
VIGSVLVAALFLGLFLVHRTRYAERLSTTGNVKKNPRKASDTDLHLDADGETMKDVHTVVHGDEAKSNGNPSSPSGTEDTAISHDEKSVEAGVI